MLGKRQDGTELAALMPFAGYRKMTGGTSATSSSTCAR